MSATQEPSFRRPAFRRELCHLIFPQKKNANAMVTAAAKVAAGRQASGLLAVSPSDPSSWLLLSQVAFWFGRGYRKKIYRLCDS